MKDITIILGILLLSIVITILYIFLMHPCNDPANKRCVGNGISIDQYQNYQCTKNDGIYLRGTLFSSSNCVFKNK